MNEPLSETLQETSLESDIQKPRRKLKPKQRLTIPLLSMAHLKILTCEVLGEMYTADIVLGIGKEAEGKPTVVKVFDLDTESEGLLICNEIIKSAFIKATDGYVGKFFQLRSGEIRDGKRYRDIDIVLMEEDN